MYIKYKNSIMNVKKYESIVKVSTDEILLWVDNHNNVMKFIDFETRNWVFSHIWMQLKADVKFLDLDEDIETYNTTEKFNI